MWLRACDHDRVIQLAKQREASVSETLRQIVMLKLKER
jgi:hypothetical protein